MHSYLSRRGLIAAVVLALSLAPTLPSGASPLTDALDGDWAGSGVLRLTNGKTERIRCHAYIDASATEVDQYFNCAGTDKNFSFSAFLRLSGNRVSGEWRGPDRSGTASGRASASRLQLALTSTRGSGNLTANVGRCTQSVRITGWSDKLRSLTVELQKEC